MPYRAEQFVNNEIYHIVLRAIDDNLLFKDLDDYYRGIFSVYEFNNVLPIKIRERRKIRIRLKETQTRSVSTDTERVCVKSIIDNRDKLVEVWAFCIMPNHLHLLARQLKDGGITKFMRKIGAGYGGYFNRKYKRKGHVFQDRFKAVHIKNDNQLKTAFTYIHTNPISIIEPNWKENGITNPDTVIDFLEEEYRWSSYFDYIGRKNFSSVTERNFFLEIMGGEQGCKNDIKNWVKYKREVRESNNIIVLE